MYDVSLYSLAPSVQQRFANNRSKALLTIDINVIDPLVNDTDLASTRPSFIVEPSSLSFDLDTWNVSRRVNVSYVDDYAEQTDTRPLVTLRHVVTSAEMPVIFMPSESVQVVPSNDDSAAILISPADTPVFVESQNNATYTVVLTSQPTEDVQISINVDQAQLAYTEPTTLTFGSENWTTPQIVTVIAREDDRFMETSSMIRLRHVATSADSMFNTSSVFVPDQDLYLRRFDDDSAGVFLSDTVGDVAEDGSNFSYAIWLLSEPLHPVEIDITNAWPAGITVSPSRLTFDASNWSSAAAVKVTAVTDSICMSSPTTASVTHSSSSLDPFYDTNASVFTPTATLRIRRFDNDVPRVQVSAVELSVAEGGDAATYTVGISCIPSAIVAVSITPSDASLVQVDPSLIEFDSSNWTSLVTVTVNAVDENRFRGSLRRAWLTHEIQSEDVSFNSSGLVVPSARVGIDRFDNDASRLELSAKHGWVVEGLTNFTYTVRLKSRPTHNVSVVLSEASDLVATTRSNILFEPDQWNESREVGVYSNEEVEFHGIENTVDILHELYSTDPTYNATEDVVRITRVDNDEASLVVVPVVVAVSEGGSATYSIRAASKPLSSMLVAISSNDSTVTVTPSSATISPLNYSQPITITISSLDDDVYWADHIAAIQHQVVQSDGWYTNSSFKPSAEVLCTVYEDEVPRVKVSRNTLFVTEGGATQSVEFSLASRPHDDVFISLSIAPDNGKLRLSQSNVTLTNTTWHTWRGVTVEAVDDTAVEADSVTEFTVTATTSSNDPEYDASALIVPSASIMVFRNDDERKHVWLKQPDLFVQEGKSIVYSIELTAQPNSPVTVVSSSSPFVSVEPSSVSFTASNWTTPAELVITAVDDEDYASDERVVQILHTAVSADAAYNSPWAAFEPSSGAVTITVFDNDGTCQHPCNPGHFTTIVNSSSRCLPCQPGYYCTGDCSLPQPCAPG